MSLGWRGRTSAHPPSIAPPPLSVSAKERKFPGSRGWEGEGGNRTHRWDAIASWLPSAAPPPAALSRWLAPRKSPGEKTFCTAALVSDAALPPLIRIDGQDVLIIPAGSRTYIFFSEEGKNRRKKSPQEDAKERSVYGFRAANIEGRIIL